MANEEQVLKQGGPEERSTTEELKASKKFPTDYNPFFPHKSPEDIISKTIKLHEQRQRRSEPQDLNGLDVLVEPVSVNGRPMCRIVATFQQDNDPNFNGAYLWIKGYMTDNALADYDENDPQPNETNVEETLPFQRLQTMTRSPSQLYLECTSERVIFGVEAFNKEGIGSGLDTMPTQTVELL